METLFTVLVIIFIVGFTIWEISLRVRLFKLIVKFVRRS